MRTIEERNTLVLQWKGIPYNVFRRLQLPMCFMGDLIQAGYLGLCNAAKTWYGTPGVCDFPLYAWREVKWAMLSELRYLTQLSKSSRCKIGYPCSVSGGENTPSPEERVPVDDLDMIEVILKKQGGDLLREHYLEEVSQTEMAERYGVSRQALGMRLRSAKDRIRTRYKNN